MQKTAILILAAGNSTRMGAIKQLLPFKNTTLLGHAINQAEQSKANAVFCVLGANTKIIEKEIEKSNSKIIYNPNFKDGLSSSIVTGVNEIKNNDFNSVLITLADQPNINADYLNDLLKSSHENPLKIIASNYNSKLGVPAIFPKEYFNQLLELKGDKGAKNILNKNQSDIIKMPLFNLTDIDTKEDYLNLIN